MDERGTSPIFGSFEDLWEGMEEGSIARRHKDKHSSQISRSEILRQDREKANELGGIPQSIKL